MVVKSKKSAILMACIFVIMAVMIAFVAGEVRYFTVPPAERNPIVVNGFSGPAPAMIAVAILLLSIGICSVVIYRLSESLYGRQGAIRWTTAGVVYGLLQQIVPTPIPSNFDFRVSSVIKQISGDLFIMESVDTCSVLFTRLPALFIIWCQMTRYECQFRAGPTGPPGHLH